MLANSVVLVNDTGRDVLRSQERTTLGFVDAAIVAVARAMDTPLVATFDRGFRGVPGVEPLPAA